MSVQDPATPIIRVEATQQPRTLSIALQAPLPLLSHYRELVGLEHEGVLVESVESGSGAGPRALVHLRALDGQARTWLEFRAALEALDPSIT
ncbi:MAG: hypothetical protein AAFZ07_29180 [Actinomycetota bacterium]